MNAPVQTFEEWVSTRYGCVDFEVEKLRDGQWVRMAYFMGPRRDAIRHAVNAYSGTVRVVEDGVRVVFQREESES